jgi:hypothetical protein
MRVLDIIKPLYEAATDPALASSNALHTVNYLSAVTDKMGEEDGQDVVQFNSYLEKITNKLREYTQLFLSKQPVQEPEDDTEADPAHQPAQQPVSQQPVSQQPVSQQPVSTQPDQDMPDPEDDEQEPVQEGSKYQRKRVYNFPEELEAAKNHLEEIKQQIVFFETTPATNKQSILIRDKALEYARMNLEAATRTFAGFKSAVDERNMYKKQKEDADKFLEEIAKYLTVLGDRVQGFSSSLENIESKKLSANDAKKIKTAQQFTSTVRQALFGLIIEIANERETSITPNQIKGFLKACVDKQVIDMNRIVGEDRGNIRDALNPKWADVFDLFTREDSNIFEYSPGKTSGAIGPGEMALSMMGSPTRKAEGHGDLEINGEMYEIKAGKKNGGRLNSKGIGKATTGWKVWSSIIEKIVKGDKENKDVFPGAPANTRFENTDNKGNPVFVNPSQYSADYVNATTKKDSKKTTYKVASKYNWNKSGIEALNSEVLVHSTRPATVALFVECFGSIFNNLNKVDERLNYLGLPNVDSLIGSAIAPDGKSVDFADLNQAMTAIAFVSYHLEDKVENIMFLNTSTLDYTITRGKLGDPSDLVGKINTGEVVITGGFNWNDSQQTPTPGYNAAISQNQ